MYLMASELFDVLHEVHKSIELGSRDRMSYQTEKKTKTSLKLIQRYTLVYVLLVNKKTNIRKKELL